MVKRRLGDRWGLQFFFWKIGGPGSVKYEIWEVSKFFKRKLAGLEFFRYHQKNGDFGIPMRTQTLRTFWNKDARNEKTRLRRLDKRFSRKANYESEEPKKKNEILYYLKNEMKNEFWKEKWNPILFDLLCEVYVPLCLQLQLRIFELYLVLLL